MANINRREINGWLRAIANISNILVLIGCLVIIVMLSLEILYPEIYSHLVLFLKLQLWICVVFLFDFLVRLIISQNRWKYLLANLVFFFVSIPYLNIIDYMHMPISEPMHYFLRTILLVRGGYGLIVVVSWITTSKLTNLFVSYLVILVSITYFSSLIFYSIEGKVNVQVKNYWDSLWWACMDVTTVGSEIVPITSWGRILSVMLAALGMCMFPIVTAFITDKFQSARFMPVNQSVVTLQASDSQKDEKKG